MHASVSLCVRVCICARVCMYLYILLCVVQGPEIAVLDWYGPEADPVYW